MLPPMVLYMGQGHSLPKLQALKRAKAKASFINRPSQHVGHDQYSDRGNLCIQAIL